MINSEKRVQILKLSLTRMDTAINSIDNWKAMFLFVIRLFEFRVPLSKLRKKCNI